LEREEAFYAARHDRDARLIIRLIEDLRWQRGLLAAAKPWLEKAQEMSGAATSAESLAQRFHEAYERLAPAFGYETREASAKPWADVPEQNRRLMIAVCRELLDAPAEVQP
jgi:hypothetical protein